MNILESIFSFSTISTKICGYTANLGGISSDFKRDIRESALCLILKIFQLGSLDGGPEETTQKKQKK